jgi:hypothetical protein
VDMWRSGPSEHTKTVRVSIKTAYNGAASIRLHSFPKTSHSSIPVILEAWIMQIIPELSSVRRILIGARRFTLKYSLEDMNDRFSGILLQSQIPAKICLVIFFVAHKANDGLMMAGRTVSMLNTC